jgi:DNA-binding NarL/FixJ family response regulator
MAEIDVVVMDVRMPVMDGIVATREIQKLVDAPKVLVLTTFDLDEYAFDALRAGASGFILKDAPGEERPR